VILTIAMDHDILERIKAGYLQDEFCEFVATTSMKGLATRERSLVHRQKAINISCDDIHENLFKLAHDSLGHLVQIKLYALLRDSYY